MALMAPQHSSSFGNMASTLYPSVNTQSNSRCGCNNIGTYGLTVASHNTNCDAAITNRHLDSFEQRDYNIFSKGVTTASHNIIQPANGANSDDHINLSNNQQHAVDK